SPPQSTSPPGLAIVSILSFVSIIGFGAACLVARYNWKTGRGDTRGAIRLLVFFTFAWLATYGLAMRFATLGRIGGILWIALGDALVRGVFYLALEPWPRRQWPQAMVSWSRVLEGRWRDPVVCRDVLLGLSFAVAAGLLLALQHFVHSRFGDAPVWFP